MCHLRGLVAATGIQSRLKIIRTTRLIRALPHIDEKSQVSFGFVR